MNEPFAVKSILEKKMRKNIAKNRKICKAKKVYEYSTCFQGDI